MKEYHFKTNGIEHKILGNLAREDFPANSIAKKIGVKSVAESIYDLVRKGLVRQTGLDYYTLTNDGLDVYHTLGVLPEPTHRKLKAEREWMHNRGNYDGAELRDTCLRPGAYNYRNHPSLVGNGSTLVWLGHGNRVIRSESLHRH